MIHLMLGRMMVLIGLILDRCKALKEIKVSSITSVDRTTGNGDPGTVDTYTITFFDLTTTTFQVTNGSVGASIDHVSKVSGTVGVTDTYTAYADVAETQPLGFFEGI